MISSLGAIGVIWGVLWLGFNRNAFAPVILLIIGAVLVATGELIRQ